MHTHLYVRVSNILVNCGVITCYEQKLHITANYGNCIELIFNLFIDSITLLFIKIHGTMSIYR